MMRLSKIFILPLFYDYVFLEMLWNKGKCAISEISYASIKAMDMVGMTRCLGLGRTLILYLNK